MTPSGLAPGLPPGKTRCLLFLATVILLAKSGAYGGQERSQGAADPDGSSPSSLGVASPAGAQDLLLTNVNVVPMDSPRVLRDQAVLIRDGLIHAIGPPDQFSEVRGAKTIDGQGGYLLPGLTDAHVHLDEAAGARPDFGDGPLYLAAGITSVVNLRGDEVSLELRRRIEQGELVAPSLYTAGEFINEPYVTSPEEVAREVERQVESGVDIITAAPATLLGREDEFGTIEVGKRADLLLVQTNPLEGLATLGKPRGVCVRGNWLSGDQLDHMLTRLAEHPGLPEPT